MTKFYKEPFEKVAIFFSTDLKKGLKQSSISDIQEKHGKNKIESQNKESLFKMLLEQLSNPIVIILMIAVVLAAITGSFFEAGLIASIVIFMACIGVYLENNASNAVEKLKNLTVPETSVIRDGKLLHIASEDVVPGDVLYLHDGDRIPADARIFESNELEVDEMLLTGESIPAKKDSENLSNDTTINDQTNMLFAGSFVVQGTVKAIVTATGLKTELGKIAQTLSEAEENPTPLQIQLEQLGKILFWGTISLSALILALTVLRGNPIIQGIIESLSLAIAFIPEGLTAIMTVVLAMGVKEMVSKRAIIKRLLAAEGMGAVSILGTDKTGTVTKGKMTVEKIWVYGKEFDVQNFKPTSDLEKKIVDVITFCNNSKGATEIALVDFLNRIGVNSAASQRIKEHRFSSELKRMSVIHKIEDSLHTYSKGAPDVLLQFCTQYADHTTNSIQTLSEQKRDEILHNAETLARQGFRVIALTYKQHMFSGEESIEDRIQAEKDLVFIALIGLMDPIRPEVHATVQKLREAGIRAIMITGDHPEIAKTIAMHAGIISDSETKVITGVELNHYFEGTNSLTKQQIIDCSVFARVTPDHKLKLVELFQQFGHNIAMAGDGINDAIAINQADIGIAVANATDIIKEAADVVVTGSYDALANAVEVGRLVMYRTRLYLHYLLSGNFCQVGVFILALAFALPFPLTAVSLLIINILTDAAPAMAMAFERTSGSVMTEPPKPKSEPIINRPMWVSIALQGIVSSIFLFGVFYFSLPHGLIFAQTATFTAYIFQKLLRGLTARSFTQSVLRYGIFSNLFMFVSLLFALAVWFVVVYLVPDIFKMQPLPLKQLGIIFGLSLALPVLEEIIKFLRNIKIIT